MTVQLSGRLTMAEIDAAIVEWDVKLHNERKALMAETATAQELRQHIWDAEDTLNYLRRRRAKREAKDAARA